MRGERLAFTPARNVRDAARAAFAAERARLVVAVPDADVRHTGGTSVDGALTKGDLDIHVRVPRARFDAARDTLDRLYLRYREEMWTRDFATFVADPARDRRPIDIGLALTAIGSEHDERFTTAWQLLAADETLLAEYNALKLSHRGRRDAARYEPEKSAFFTRVVASAARRSG